MIGLLLGLAAIWIYIQYPRARRGMTIGIILLLIFYAARELAKGSTPWLDLCLIFLNLLMLPKKNDQSK